MEDYEIEEKKQAAADVLYQYSQFVMVCVGERVRPCDLRLHLMKVYNEDRLWMTSQLIVCGPSYPVDLFMMKRFIRERHTAISGEFISESEEISGMPTSLKRETPKTGASPDVVGEPSSSSANRGEQADITQAL